MHDAQNERAALQQHLERTEDVLDGLSAYRPPAVPPSPAPPRLPGAPQVPQAVPFAEYVARLQRRVDALDAEIARLDASLDACVPSATTTCGRSSTLAPDPWTAADGQRCFGATTFEALEGAFCGYWTNTVRADRVCVRARGVNPPPRRS